MAFWDLFMNRNKNELSHEEKEAAQILKNIVFGYKQGDYNYIPNGIEKLSIGLYYLAFKRSSKKVIHLEEIFKPESYMLNLKTQHYIHYVGIYSAIKESIEDFCKNPLVLKTQASLDEYEKTILQLLKYTAEKINQV